MGVLLFLAANNWGWTQAWAFLAILAAGSVAFSVWLLPRDPALLADGRQRLAKLPIGRRSRGTCPHPKTAPRLSRRSRYLLTPRRTLSTSRARRPIVARFDRDTGAPLRAVADPTPRCVAAV